MAKMGLKLFAWAEMLTEPDNAPPTYGPGVMLGMAVSTNMTIANAEGELFADDMLAEYVSEFSSAALTAEVDNIDLPRQAILYGARYSEERGMECYPDDTPPYGGVSGYQVLMKGGKRKFRAWFFAKAKASMPDWTGTTKGSSISFGTEPIAMKLMAPTSGPWYRVREFTVEAAARAFVEELLNVQPWHEVSVLASGNGSAKAEGGGLVAEGGSIDIVIEGTPTALFDNGVDKVGDIVDGKYTIANVTERHSVAVIF